MRDILKKVTDETPERILGHNILLPANMAITALYDGTTV